MNNKLAEQTATAIRQKITHKPEIGVILGSGLGNFVDEMTEIERIPYESLPHFPLSTVAGHEGNFVFGKLAGKTIAVMQGRFHFYEGYSLDKVIFPIQVLHDLRIKTLIVTNASGGVNQSFQPGDLMLITDQINNLSKNPFRGGQSENSVPYITEKRPLYSPLLNEIAKNAATTLNFHLKSGVYVANSGPTYETPAEIQMITKMGGDAVGMSTVPEVLAAHRAGIEVLGISCISNMAAGIAHDRLSHEEVVETAGKVKGIFARLLKEIIKQI